MLRFFIYGDNVKNYHEKILTIDTIKDGYLYYVHARNGGVGIAINGGTAFEISRNKFGSNFIDTEDHYDHERGTVWPFLEIEKTPLFVDYKEKLDYLNKHERNRECAQNG